MISDSNTILTKLTEEEGFAGSLGVHALEEASAGCTVLRQMESARRLYSIRC